jgi:choline monooxygenase
MAADYTLWREEGAPEWRAAGLDGTRYTAPARLAAERERVFARTWQLAGRLDQVAEAGDYFACEIAGEPLLVVRGGDGVLRAFYNVCKHRGRELVACGSSGRLRAVACPYHGWCYDLDGRLRAVPEQAAFPDLDVAAIALDPVAVDVCHGLVFVRLAHDGEPLRDYLAPIGDLLGPALEPAVLVGARSIPLAANWKTGLEAFLETNHIASLHPRVGKGLRFDETALAHFRRHSLTVVPSVKAADWASRRQRPWREWVTDPGSAEVHYSIFPNVTLHLFAWGLTFLFRCTPDAHDPERMVLDVWSWKRLAPGETPPPPLSMPDAMNAVFQQDYDNIPLVQRGVRSRAFRGPTLSVVESRIGHFHAVLDACLA